MKCSNCGCEVKEGSTYCENCGADLVEVVTLDKTSVDKVKEFEKNQKKVEAKKREEIRKAEEEKLKKERQEKAKNRPVFYDDKRVDIACTLSAFGAGALMLVFLFLRYVSVSVYYDEGFINDGFSVSNLAANGNKSVYPIIVLFIVCAVIMIYFAFVDNITKVEMPFQDIVMKYDIFIRPIPLIMAIVLIIVFTHLGAYKYEMGNLERVQAAYGAYIDNFKYMNGTGAAYYARLVKGPGFFAYILSLVMYVASQCLRFIISTMHED